jgi:hypothetical protein
LRGGLGGLFYAKEHPLPTSPCTSRKGRRNSANAKRLN